VPEINDVRRVSPSTVNFDISFDSNLNRPTYEVDYFVNVGGNFDKVCFSLIYERHVLNIYIIHLE